MEVGEETEEEGTELLLMESISSSTSPSPWRAEKRENVCNTHRIKYNVQKKQPFWAIATKLIVISFLAFVCTKSRKFVQISTSFAKHLHVRGEMAKITSARTLYYRNCRYTEIICSIVQ